MNAATLRKKRGPLLRYDHQGLISAQKEIIIGSTLKTTKDAYDQMHPSEQLTNLPLLQAPHICNIGDINTSVTN